MNVMNVFDRVCKEFNQLDFTIKDRKDDSIRFTADVTLKKYYKDGIFISCTVYTGGTMHIFFTFDHLDENLNTLHLLNEFNDNSSWFKAYITQKGDKKYLELHYAAVGPDDEAEAADNFGFILRQLMSDTTVKYLSPLSQITY